LNPASRDRLLNAGLGLAIAAALSLAVLIGETGLAPSQYAEAVRDLSSGPAEVLWQVRAPRALCALMVGAALGLAGAVLQGLLRNPLADPGVLGVSATAALGAALAIVLVFIGSKIFIADLAGLDKFPHMLSLGITFLILASGIAYSLWKTRQPAAH
jgi:ABC-type Fe3+-siderophore transport system permease subunit